MARPIDISVGGSSGFLVGGTGHERASKRPHLRTVDRWNADWGALALMVERWLVPLIPFPSYKLCVSDRPGAVKGARFARRSEPLTARTDLESYEGEGKGILQPSSHLPTKNPEYPRRNGCQSDHRSTNGMARVQSGSFHTILQQASPILHVGERSGLGGLRNLILSSGSGRAVLDDARSRHRCLHRGGRVAGCPVSGVV